MSSIKQIAIYGKGGIGKSTICCNLSIAMTMLGEKVFQIGCSPKTDSTSMLNGGEMITPGILENVRRKGINRNSLMECIRLSPDGVYCAETGGPEPAKGCAGKGVTVALELISKYRVIEEIGATVVFYDVIGDIVCGGFAMPMRKGFANDIYIVTSGELMSLYSASNICIAIADAASDGGSARVSGIIGNMRGVKGEWEIINDFAKMTGVPIIASLPRDNTIQECEVEGVNVIKKYEDSDIAKKIREIASIILKNKRGVIPRPVQLEELMELLKKYQSPFRKRLRASA